MRALSRPQQHTHAACAAVSAQSCGVALLCYRGFVIGDHSVFIHVHVMVCQCAALYE